MRHAVMAAQTALNRLGTPASAPASADEADAQYAEASQLMADALKATGARIRAIYDPGIR